MMTGSVQTEKGRCRMTYKVHESNFGSKAYCEDEETAIDIVKMFLHKYGEQNVVTVERFDNEILIGKEGE